jgi:hypothetical protein
MKADVGLTRQIALRNFNRRRRIDAVKMANPRGDKLGPTTAATANIAPLRIWRQTLPRENRKIARKYLLPFTIRHRGLIESFPFVAEALNRFNIDISHNYSLALEQRKNING